MKIYVVMENNGYYDDPDDAIVGVTTEYEKAVRLSEYATSECNAGRIVEYDTEEPVRQFTKGFVVERSEISGCLRVTREFNWSRFYVDHPYRVRESVDGSYIFVYVNGKDREDAISNAEKHFEKYDAIMSEWDSLQRNCMAIGKPMPVQFRYSYYVCVLEER